MGIHMVTHKMRFLLQECRAIYYYDETVGAPSTSEWQDIADEIRVDYDTELKTNMATSWDFYGISHRVVDTAGLPSFDVGLTAGTLVGTQAADELPTQIAMLITLKGTTAKPNRMRKYLPGWCENAVTNGLFLSGQLGQGEAFVALQTALNSGGTNPLTQVAAQWNTSHTQVIATNDISGGVLQSFQVPATQRRRRIGVGI